VPPEEIASFLKELGGGMCAVALRYNNGKAADLPAVAKILAEAGGHIVQHSAGKLGAGDRLDLWTSANGIEALAKLDNVRFVQPWRNWNDPHKVPVIKITPV
jgi:hypothetical protein